MAYYLAKNRVYDPAPAVHSSTHAGGRYVCLESVMHPGQHVGIMPVGNVKSPGQTRKGLHGRFTPTLYTPCTSPPSSTQSGPTTDSSIMVNNIVGGNFYHPFLSRIFF